MANLNEYLERAVENKGKFKMKNSCTRFTFVALLATGQLASMYTASDAAEGGAGFYLLGSKGVAAAVMPPAGLFFQNDFYYYTGSLGNGRALPSGGKIVADVDGKAAISVPTFLWVLPHEFAGGRVGVSTSIPFGWKKTSADLVLDGPRVNHREGYVSDDVFTIGDPVVSGMIGWEKGNFHWQTGVMVNVPIGDYQDGEISNIAFHHWGADVFAAATWIEPTTGIDISGVIGMTFNAENPATDYRTGNEFHLEWAISKQFTPQFSAGLIGYYYDQVTGDSGAGASLGDFKGKVAAIGGTIGYTFMIDKLPLSTRIKYFHEFSAENRAEGDAIFATISIPLAITKP